MKKTFRFLLAFFLFVFLSMGSYKVNAQNFMNAKISSVETAKDTKVDVTISFTNIPKQGIAACDFKIGFDNSTLQVDSIVAGELIKNPQLDFSYNIVNNEIIIMFVDESLGDRLIKSDGTFARIRFYVKGSAKDGTYPVVLKSIGSFSDNDLKKLDVKFENGAVIIKSNNNSTSNGGGTGTIGSDNSGSTNSGTTGQNNGNNSANNTGNSDNKNEEKKNQENDNNQKQDTNEQKNSSSQGTSNISKTNLNDKKVNITVYQTKVNKVLVNKNKTILVNFNYNIKKINSGKIYLLDSKGVKYSISITYKGNVITIKPLKNLPKGKYTLVFSRGTILNAYNKYNLADIKTTFSNK